MLSRDDFDTRILALPVGHLQLSERARLALRYRETIGGLIAALGLGRRRWSSLVRSEISLALDQLTNAMHCAVMRRFSRQNLRQFKA